MAATTFPQVITHMICIVALAMYGNAIVALCGLAIWRDRITRSKAMLRSIHYAGVRKLGESAVGDLETKVNLMELKSYVTPVKGSMSYMITDDGGVGASLVTILSDWIIIRTYYPQKNSFRAMHSKTMREALDSGRTHRHFDLADECLMFMEMIAEYWGYELVMDEAQ